MVKSGTKWSRAIGRVSLLWRRFTPLEEFLLDILQRELPLEAQRINQRRIDAIRRVVRLLDWTEISFYERRRRGEGELPRFPCNDEIVLAKIRFSPEGISETWTSRIIAVNGRMFCFVTRPSPKEISFCEDYAVKEVLLVDDPMEKNCGGVLERLQSRLPRDFDQYAGKTVSGWSVFEKDAVYDVHIEEGDYVVIAEREGEASYLGIRGEGSKDVWYLPHDGPIEKVGNTLEAAIRNRLP